MVFSNFICYNILSKLNKICYVGSFAISTFGGSPTMVEAPPMFENMQIAIKKRTGSIARNIFKNIGITLS